MALITSGCDKTRSPSIKNGPDHLGLCALQEHEHISERDVMAGQTAALGAALARGGAEAETAKRALESLAGGSGCGMAMEKHKAKLEALAAKGGAHAEVAEKQRAALAASGTSGLAALRGQQAALQELINRGDEVEGRGGEVAEAARRQAEAAAAMLKDMIGGLSRTGSGDSMLVDMKGLMAKGGSQADAAQAMLLSMTGDAEGGLVSTQLQVADKHLMLQQMLDSGGDQAEKAKEMLASLEAGGGSPAEQLAEMKKMMAEGGSNGDQAKAMLTSITDDAAGGLAAGKPPLLPPHARRVWDWRSPKSAQLTSVPPAQARTSCLGRSNR